MNNDHFGGENSMVVGAQDEYERQNDQELPHKRRARLRFSAPDDDAPALPLMDIEEPMFLQN